jgi:cell division septum initiation protein DivIVA
MLARFRTWTPFDGDALLDDVADALDTVLPPDAEVEQLSSRLRAHLTHLTSVAATAKAEERDKRAAQLVARARQTREEEPPGDYQQAAGHLRRMGWAVNELLDLLVATGCVEAPESLKEEK